MRNLWDAILVKGLPKKDLKNASIFNFWALSWAVSLGASLLASTYGLLTPNWVFFAVLIAHMTIGIFMILAFKRFLSALDEMERKVQFDAMAFSVGVTMLIYSSLSVLKFSGRIEDVTSEVLIFSLSLGYAAGLIIGRARLR
mgnify:CR=1 FL=1